MFRLNGECGIPAHYKRRIRQYKLVPNGSLSNNIIFLRRRILFKMFTLGGEVICYGGKGCVGGKPRLSSYIIKSVETTELINWCVVPK